jgi:hypothetical protein
VHDSSEKLLHIGNRGVSKFVVDASFPGGAERLQYKKETALLVTATTSQSALASTPSKSISHAIHSVIHASEEAAISRSVNTLSMILQYLR